jgi:hypothetical protein
MATMPPGRRSPIPRALTGDKKESDEGREEGKERDTVAGEHRQKSGLSFQILTLKGKRFHGKGDFLLL